MRKTLRPRKKAGSVRPAQNIRSTGPQPVDTSWTGRNQKKAEATFGLWLKLAVITFVLANLIQTSELLFYINKASVRIIYAVELVIILAFVCLDVFEKKIVPVAITVLAFLYIMMACETFSLNTGTAFNFNSALSYLVILSFCLFANRHLSLKKLASAIYIATFLYALIYIVVSIWFPSDFTHVIAGQGGQNIKVFGRDHYVDSRVVLSTPYIAFGIFYSLAKLIEKIRIFHIACLVTFALAVVLSNYRLFEAVLIVLIPCLFFMKHLRRAPWIFPLLFVMGSLFSMSGVFDHQFNFYSHFVADASGNARYIEYETAKEIIDKHPFFGLGIPSSREDMNATVQAAHPLFYDDIGAMGIWCGFGLAGILVYLGLGVTTCFFSYRKVAELTAGEKALIFVGLFMSLYAWTAPTFFGGTGTLFAAMILASHYRRLGRSITKVQRRAPVESKPVENARVASASIPSLPLDSQVIENPTGVPAPDETTPKPATPAADPSVA